MKSTHILLTGCLLCASMSIDAAILTFKVANATAGDKAVITLSDKTRHEAVVDAAGNATLEINGFEAQYATMRYGRAQKTLYLDPEQDLTLIFDGKTPWKAISFEGEGATVNSYLNSGKFKAVGYQDSKLSESAFIARADSFYQANMDALKAANLPASFTKDEEQRVKFVSYDMLPLYGIYHGYTTKDTAYVSSEAYYDKVQQLATIDGKLLKIGAYKNFILNAMACLSGRGLGKVENGDIARYVNYAVEHVKDAEVLQHIVNQFVYGKISGGGMDGQDELIATFRKYVTDAEMVKKFDEICEKWSVLRAGMPSPSFEYLDIDGKTVKLSDLRGKYVYIDVWATWCGPCRGELPHLKKLEEKYHGKDIHFVSISTDKDKKAWENMVRKDQMKGIQLHQGGDRSFSKAYIINGIPRFILIDREGKIISADMTRPSNPETAKKFDELLAK